MAPSRDGIAVFLPLTISIGTILCTIVIHGFALVTIVGFVRRERQLGRAGTGFWRDLIIVAGTVLVAFAAHLVEIAGWAMVFVLCHEFPDYAAALYHSAVNYTTLGYGDVIMSASWRLLGPMEAADGSLMFGVSTGMIFAVILRLVQARFPDSNT